MRPASHNHGRVIGRPGADHRCGDLVPCESEKLMTGIAPGRRMFGAKNKEKKRGGGGGGGRRRAKADCWPKVVTPEVVTPEDRAVVPSIREGENSVPGLEGCLCGVSRSCAWSRQLEVFFPRETNYRSLRELGPQTATAVAPFCPTVNLTPRIS